MPGGRKPGRQRIRWEDNIEELTKLKFADSQVAARDRDTWRQITIRSAKLYILIYASKTTRIEVKLEEKKKEKKSKTTAQSSLFSTVYFLFFYKNNLTLKCDIKKLQQHCHHFI